MIDCNLLEISVSLTCRILVRKLRANWPAATRELLIPQTLTHDDPWMSPIWLKKKGAPTSLLAGAFPDQP